MKTKLRRAGDRPGSLPPPELVSTRLELAGERFLVLSFPAPHLDATALSPAEREILRAILDGRTNRAIAQRRRTSVRTVANQVAAILKKLGANSRYELARRFGRRAKR
jgi:DNA-binding NarL/FixJ family response regulator